MAEAGRTGLRGDEGAWRHGIPAVAGLLLAALTAALDQAVVSTALATIVGELGGVEALSKVVTAYLLASAASTPPWGKLGDLCGRRPVFRAAGALFLLGSVLSGLSQGILQLILFRGLRGLGGGGPFVGAQAILGDVVSPRERGRYQGYFGAVLGGFFVQSLSWRWTSFASVPLGVVASLLPRLPDGDREGCSREIDYPDTALLTAGVPCLVLSTSLGGNVYPRVSGQVPGLGVLGVALHGELARLPGRLAGGLLLRDPPEPERTAGLSGGR